VSAEAFRFMDVKPMTVGMANCLVQRVSYTGDLGYEIFCDHMSVRHLWTVLRPPARIWACAPSACGR
jgi:dimethylglycine dehydrogenase